MYQIDFYLPTVHINQINCENFHTKFAADKTLLLLLPLEP